MKIKFNTIREKLQMGVLSQIVLVALLVVFIVFFNFRLNNVTQNKVEHNAEIAKIRDFAKDIDRYLSREINFGELTTKFEMDINDSTLKRNKILIKSFNDLRQIESLRSENDTIFKKVLAFTDESMSKSDGYINGTADKLISQTQRARVTVLERAVIKGAHLNTHNNFSIKLLFQNVIMNVPGSEQKLTEHLDIAIAQAAGDAEKLKNTPFAQLPIDAKKLNEVIKEMTLTFIDNTKDIKRLSTQIKTDNSNLVHQINNEDIEETRSTFSRLTFSITLIFVFLLGISVFIIVMNYRIAQTIRGSLTRLKIVFTQISNGHLTHKFLEKNINRKDEFGELFRKLRDMTEKLREIVAQIRESADAIASGSMQISSSASQIAQGANEQASSTEEISASMEEMSSSINQNSENAHVTEKMAMNASDNIERVGKAAKNSLVSVREIIDKIKVIGDIAEKTDLLAINAAVEAARAGEHGKGFAVVASEVRKLAENSQRAALEIDEFSKSSLTVTEEAGLLMEQIAPEIKKNADLVREISAASEEQNSGAKQVNSAIQQLSLVTQQNSASAEELASSSEQLSAQAHTLRDAIGYFKLDEKDVNSVSQIFDLIDKHNKEIDKLKGQLTRFENTETKIEEKKEEDEGVEVVRSKNNNGISLNLEEDDKDFEEF